jgi:hypothetical protein
MRIKLETKKENLPAKDKWEEHFISHVKHLFPNIKEFKVNINEKKDRVIANVVQN